MEGAVGRVMGEASEERRVLCPDPAGHRSTAGVLFVKVCRGGGVVAGRAKHCEIT